MCKPSDTYGGCGAGEYLHTENILFLISFAFYTLEFIIILQVQIFMEKVA